MMALITSFPTVMQAFKVWTLPQKRSTASSGWYNYSWDFTALGHQVQQLGLWLWLPGTAATQTTGNESAECRQFPYSVSSRRLLFRFAPGGGRAGLLMLPYRPSADALPLFARDFKALPGDAASCNRHQACEAFMENRLQVLSSLLKSYHSWLEIELR